MLVVGEPFASYDSLVVIDSEQHILHVRDVAEMNN
jgi:hypothetical protein